MATTTAVSKAARCGCSTPSEESHRSVRSRLRQALRRVDLPLAGMSIVLALLLIFLPDQATRSLRFTGESLAGVLPWLLVSVAVAAYARASGLDGLVAGVFTGRPARMIIVASLFGALSPFCSCGVIPVVAGLLAAGVPLAPVMAFWLSSPLMDPTMFALTAATIGLPFAVAKTSSAIGIGLLSGLITHALGAAGWLDGSGLRIAAATNGSPARVAVRWNVFASGQGRRVFLGNATTTGGFLLRWMALAFLLESLMVAWVPAESVVAVLGRESMAIPTAVVIGVPAYLNGFAALPLVSGLIDLGMSPAAGLAFLVSGGIASLPAAAAVWALARPRVFVLYLGLGAVGSLLTAYAYALVLALTP